MHIICIDLGSAPWHSSTNQIFHGDVEFLLLQHQLCIVETKITKKGLVAAALPHIILNSIGMAIILLS